MNLSRVIKNFCFYNVLCVLSFRMLRPDDALIHVNACHLAKTLFCQKLMPVPDAKADLLLSALLKNYDRNCNTLEIEFIDKIISDQHKEIIAGNICFTKPNILYFEPSLGSSYKFNTLIIGNTIYIIDSKHKTKMLVNSNFVDSDGFFGFMKKFHFDSIEIKDIKQNFDISINSEKMESDSILLNRRESSSFVPRFTTAVLDVSRRTLEPSSLKVIYTLASDPLGRKKKERVEHACKFKAVRIHPELPSRLDAIYHGKQWEIVDVQKSILRILIR